MRRKSPCSSQQKLKKSPRQHTSGSVQSECCAHIRSSSATGEGNLPLGATGGALRECGVGENGAMGEADMASIDRAKASIIFRCLKREKEREGKICL